MDTILDDYLSIVDRGKVWRVQFVMLGTFYSCSGVADGVEACFAAIRRYRENVIRTAWKERLG